MKSNPNVRIKILKSGIYTSIQDEGRYGYRYHAIPQSGCLDYLSSRLAQYLVGNNASSGIIECNITGASFEFLTDAKISLTGADMQWTIDHVPVERNRLIEVKMGQKLYGKNSINGMRGYLGVQGNIIAQNHYNSISSYHYARLGGLTGGRLQSGEVLTYVNEGQCIEKIVGSPIIDYKAIKAIGILPGPEWPLFTARQQQDFLHKQYYITEDSNRMGAKLLTDTPLVIDHRLKLSHTVVPGIIQLPPDGQAIVILQDGQTTGGYPRIAYIPKNELCSFNQIMPRQGFQFYIAG